MWDNFFGSFLPQAVSSVSLTAFAAVYAGGILTSISPCILTMVPVIIGFIGGHSGPEARSGLKGFVLSAVFVLGLSVTFALFGVIAVLLGRVFGQAGGLWYYILAAVAIAMGLQLLGVININFPTLQRFPVKKQGLAAAFLMGLFFGLVASPCATPVLAVIVTYVASTGNIFYGAALLFVYGLGHGLPLMAAGTFTAVVKHLPRFSRYTHYITLFSGTALIIAGLYLLILVRW